MSNRFEAIGSFVYEKGNRIGVTPDEASVEIARKLNAYQMRIERLKAEVERLTKLCQATSPDGFIHIRDINAAKEGNQP